MILMSYCELGFCPYCDNDEYDELTCEDCPHWVEDFCPEFDFSDEDII